MTHRLIEPAPWLVLNIQRYQILRLAAGVKEIEWAGWWMGKEYLLVAAYF